MSAPAGCAMRFTLLCALLAALSLGQAAWAQSAGQITAMQRLVWLQKPNGTINPVEPGATFEAGDLISTGHSSSARLLFSDGGEVTLRPDTQLRVEQFSYRADTPASDNALLRLLKGGMRAVTGFVGKRGKPDAYRVGAVTSTIGVRGTDFVARICGADCTEESAKLPSGGRAPVPPPAGRVVVLQGGITATDTRGNVRELAPDGAIYQGDTLRSGSDAYAVLVFRDESRVTLARDSMLVLDQFRYEPVRSEQNLMVLRLLRGGLRSLSGLIAKRRHEAYRLNAVVATIGVRGTGWDALTRGDCAPDTGATSAARDVAKECALTVQTWEGAIVVENELGSADVSRDATAGVNGRSAAPKLVAGTVQPLFDENTPRPDKVNVDYGGLFGQASSKYDDGLYVYVRDGKVFVADAGGEIILERGEGVYVDDKGGAPVRTDPPLSLQHDPYLQRSANICQ